MKQSLLYDSGTNAPLQENSSAGEHNFNEKLIEDFMLDRCFSELCADRNKCDYFLSIIASPLTNPADIAYRAEILRDFTATPNLLEGLKRIFASFTVLKEEQQRERTRNFSIARTTDSEQAFSSGKAIAQLSAITAKKALLFLQDMGEQIQIYRPQSRGLQELSRRIRNMTTGEAFDRLILLCTRAENLSDTDIYDVTVQINEEARIVSYEINAIISPVKTPEPTGLKRLFASKTKQDQTIDGLIIEDDIFAGLKHLKDSLLGNALLHLSELFSKISKSIFDEFALTAQELTFYDIAALYWRRMTQKNIPLTYPEIKISGETKIEGLYDLLLCVTYPGKDNVVCNDALFGGEIRGIVITGENNSGKTVYLRSVGTAQLLAQAGLPVLAKSARITVRTGIYTQYAASEKEFTAGNEAGRFEQEVRAVSAMLDEIRPDSLILFNEIFQTTAYSEGAEGLYHILNYLYAKGISFLLVSHLHDIIPKLGDQAVHMQTLDGGQKYKLHVVAGNRATVAF